jgi:hypothetical protein
MPDNADEFMYHRLKHVGHLSVTYKELEQLAMDVYMSGFRWGSGNIPADYKDRSTILDEFLQKIAPANRDE